MSYDLATQNAIAAWLLENHSLTIKKVSRRELRGCMTTTTDDLEQHIWECLLDWSLTEEGKGTDFRTWNAFGMADLMTKIARKFIARERIDYMHFAGAFVYTPSIVEVYLKDAVWANLEDVVDLDGRMDVRDAIRSLPLATQQALFVHYGMDQPYDQRTDRSNYNRVIRAVDTIADRLNMGSGVKLGDLADAS